MKEIKLPNYEHSILNTITSILKYYNVETKHKSLQTLDSKLNKKFRNIVLIILDGMGESILKTISPNGFFAQHEIECVTSVFPSTTTSALTTYYSGKPPYETGWIAWSQYFKEYGRAIDMLPQKESDSGDYLKNVKKDVFKEIVNYDSVFKQIENANKNIKAYEVMPDYSVRKSKRTITADNLSEIIESIKLLCQNNEEKFIMAYSDNPDGLLHKYGTDSKEVKDFILNAENQITEMCKEISKDTIVLVTADHGHLNIENPHTIIDYPEIMECLYMPVSLEARTLTFWVKENMKDLFEKRFNDIFKDEFWLMTKEEFLEKNHLLGYGKKHRKIDDFIGNYVAISISNSMIKIENYLSDGKPIKKSTHCGITKEEMEVPLIVIN